MKFCSLPFQLPSHALAFYTPLSTGRECYISCLLLTPCHEKKQFHHFSYESRTLGQPITATNSVAKIEENASRRQIQQRLVTRASSCVKRLDTQAGVSSEPSNRAGEHGHPAPFLLLQLFGNNFHSESQSHLAADWGVKLDS